MAQSRYDLTSRYDNSAGTLPRVPAGRSGSSAAGGCLSNCKFRLRRIRPDLNRIDRRDTVRRVFSLPMILVFGSSLFAHPEQANAAQQDVKQIADPARRTESVRARSGWSVQIAAFLHKEHSLRLVKTLNRKGYRSFVVETVVQDRIWHRVRVGRLATQAEAEVLQQRLKSQECFHDAFVVAHALQGSTASHQLEPGMKVRPPAELAPRGRISLEPASSAGATKPQAASEKIPADPDEPIRGRSKKPPCKWSVQVVAFPTLTESLSFADQLQKKGYAPYLNEAFICERHWYRVRLGELETREQAEELLKTLQFKEGFRDAFIVAR
jgi:cell division septation protein DedD